MGNIKEINVKNRTYYIFNDMINIKDFHSSLLKKTKSHTKILVFTTLDTLQLKELMENICSVNPLYLMIGEVIGNIEENNGNKYLVFDSSDENKKNSKKYTELWDVVKNKIETIKGGECKYGQDFMTTKFNTDDDLPLNKPLNLHILTVIARSVFKDEGKF